MGFLALLSLLAGRRLPALPLTSILPAAELMEKGGFDESKEER